MVDFKEVLQIWMAGAKKNRIAAQLTINIKTARRYIAAAERVGLVPGLSRGLLVGEVPCELLEQAS